MLRDGLGITGVEVLVRGDEPRPQAQQIQEAVGRPLPRVERFAREIAHQGQPLVVAWVLDDVRELVVRLHAGQHSAKLVVVVGVLETGAVLQDIAHAGHQLRQILAAHVHCGEE